MLIAVCLFQYLMRKILKFIAKTFKYLARELVQRSNSLTPSDLLPVACCKLLRTQPLGFDIEKICLAPILRCLVTSAGFIYDEITNYYILVESLCKVISWLKIDANNNSEKVVCETTREAQIRDMCFWNCMHLISNVEVSTPMHSDDEAVVIYATMNKPPRQIWFIKITESLDIPANSSLLGDTVAKMSVDELGD